MIWRLFLLILSASIVVAARPAEALGLPSLCEVSTSGSGAAETQSAPRKATQGSLPIVEVVREFSLAGVKVVLLRASSAESAAVRTAPAGSSTVTVSAIPSASHNDYSIPGWHTTLGTRQGLDFVARQFGSTLVISAQKEISEPHHRYALKQIQVALPVGVKLIREPHPLAGNGAADLSAP